MSNTSADNNIYYFLGNISSHIVHALPLYKKLGGTFIVLSDKARREVEIYDVPVINIDNVPFQLKRLGHKIKPIFHYSTITKRHKRTVDFLNKNARVVLFYELYDFAEEVRLESPKTIFLTHGNMLKDYMAGNHRLDIIKQYDYMAALGPHMKQQFIQDGVDPKKLVDIGIARTDDIVSSRGRVVISQRTMEELGIDPLKKIIAYVPTFWGASSIYNTGLRIIQDIPKEYTLIFRPHPQTPKKLLRKYLNIISSKPNIIYAPEGKFKGFGLVELFKASSVIIGDVSSVMLEAILTYKPLIFAYDSHNRKEIINDLEPIKTVINSCHNIESTRSDIQESIQIALKTTIDKTIWKDAVSYNFFDYNGDAVKNIVKFINK